MPTPIRWRVPRELSPQETRVAAKLRRVGKFYVFLREIRAELFDEAFEAELAAAYQPRGMAPLPPALLAMVTLLQAYDQVGDAEAVVTAQNGPALAVGDGVPGGERRPVLSGRGGEIPRAADRA
jgi:hypothetical protein